MFQAFLQAMEPTSTENADADYKRIFFAKETFLTVSGQLNGGAHVMYQAKFARSVLRSSQNPNTKPPLWGWKFWMVEPEGFQDSEDIAVYLKTC